MNSYVLEKTTSGHCWQDVDFYLRFCDTLARVYVDAPGFKMNFRDCHHVSDNLLTISIIRQSSGKSVS